MKSTEPTIVDFKPIYGEWFEGTFRRAQAIATKDIHFRVVCDDIEVIVTPESKNAEFEVGAGQSFESAFKKAKNLATPTLFAQYIFNGVTCVISPDTKYDLLLRDYQNSWTMGWETVGHDCKEEYSQYILDQLKERRERQAIENERQDEYRKNAEARQKAEFEKKTAGMKIELANEELWNDFVSKNTDPLGKAIIDYAEGLAILMQIEFSKGNKLVDMDDVDVELHFMGISGAMYGAAISTLCSCWKYGEALKEWHNRKYNYTGDGVVDPSILTIK